MVAANHEDIDWTHNGKAGADDADGIFDYRPDGGVNVGP